MKTGTSNTYFVSALEGWEEGPLSLAEMKRRLSSGALTGASFVRRSDAAHRSTAADFPELEAKDVVTSRYDAQAGPDALTQEAEAFACAKEVRKGASWFFWIAALSVINSLAAVFGSAWGFALGLSSCCLVGGMGSAFGGAGPWMAFAVNLVACGLFLHFGIAGWKGRFWPYAVGMFLYAGDALLPLLVQDWISLVIHGVALYFLVAGFKVLMDQHNIEWNTGLLLKAGACVAVLAGLGGALFFTLLVNAKQAKPPAEPWVKDAVGSWPQLVLTHEAKFRGHSGLDGATAFLINLPNGDTVAATARHLLGAAGGVSPELKPANMDTSLVSWRLHPRGEPDAELAVSGLYGAPARYLRANEWLLLKLKTTDGDDLPAEPLSLRDAPAKVGEAIYVVGARYENEKNVQEVFPAKVTSTATGLILGLLQDRADFAGFSGAPVLDADGHLVGMVVGAGGAPDKNGTYSGFAAYPVAELKRLLEN